MLFVFLIIKGASILVKENLYYLYSLSKLEYSSLFKKDRAVLRRPYPIQFLRKREGNLNFAERDSMVYPSPQTNKKSGDSRF